MNLPRYLEGDRVVLLRPSFIEFEGDFPGFRLTDRGFSLSIANSQKWAEPVTLVLPAFREANHLRIRLASGIRANLNVIHLASPDQGAFALSLELSEGASLKLIDLYLGTDSSMQTVDRFAAMDRKSSLEIATGLIGGSRLTMKDEWDLLAEESRLSADLLAIAGAKEQWKITQTTRHLAPETTSSTTNLLISAHDAVLNLSVSGHIGKGNHHSDCQQTNRGVILGEKGVIAVEPQLLIDEYDVKAGHGCAIGQINPEELYYLQTRGLSESEAKRLIVAGYLSPLLNKITQPALARQVNRRINRKMKGADL